MEAFLQAHSWLKELGGSFLSEAAQQMVNGLRENVEQKKYEAGKALASQLTRYADKSINGLEVAEILVECARAQYLMGDFALAANSLKRAGIKYKIRIDYAALVQWMMGCALSKIAGRVDEAIAVMQKGMDDFRQVAVQPVKRMPTRWYNHCTEMMLKELNALVEKNVAGASTPPPRPAEPSPAAGPAASSSSAPAGERSPSTAIPRSGFIEMYPWVEAIPAGGFGPSGSDPFVKGFVQINQVLIDNKPHRIVQLSGSQIFRLKPSETYMVIKVMGDSMNLSGIEYGDYLLLRQQETAKNNDIVVVEIVEEHASMATIKRFVRSSKKILLQPNSSNPVHKEFEFSKPKEGFYIRGVAVAVFKPVKGAS